MNDRIKIVIALIFLLVSIVYAYSIGTFELNTCVNLVQTCSNCSYVNVTSITYPNTTKATSNVEMTKDGSFYNYSFCKANLTGKYIATGVGDLDGESTVWDYEFSITPNGEDVTTGKGIFYLGLLVILAIFMCGSIYMFVTFDNLLARVGMFGLTYLLLIAITFIAWNMSSDFLTSSPFIISMFRILFFTLVIGVFPLIVGSFAWYVIMLFRIKEIENLMTKGISYDEAKRRQGKKYK